MKIASIIYDSLVNGPGIRDVIFFQGCCHHCEDCQNKHTWNFDDGIEMTTEDILNALKIDIDNIDGVTISGGDGFYQYGGLLELCKAMNKKGIHVMVYSGFTKKEIEEIFGTEIFKYINILVDGLYIKELKTDKGYAGSSNQHTYFFNEK